MLKRILGVSLALSSYMVSCTVYAIWEPRVTGLGEMGGYGSLWADGLFPLQDVSNQVVFFDFQVEDNRFYSGNLSSGILSPGFGLRHAFTNDNVLGLYLFSDYMMTNLNQNYWFVSPGLDFYHDRWYGVVNGYIPVNNSPRASGPHVLASSIGLTKYESFSGNSQYDSFVQNFYSMRWGIDFTGGVLFGDRNEWGLKLGGYIYDEQNLNAINGIRGGFDYFVNDSVAITFEERYDSVFHNQAVIGLKVSFFGNENRGTVKTQLKAPMYRNLNINTTNAGTPIGEYLKVNSQKNLIQSNITFVSNLATPGAGLLSVSSTSGNGTYENPYTELTQDIINNIDTNSKIWVEGTGVSHPYSNATTLTLLTGQSIYGRTAGFKLDAAIPSLQPIFNFAPNDNTAALYIDNTNTLQNFIMHGNGVSGSRGIEVANTGLGTANINGVTIGTTTDSTGYSVALYNQGANVSLNGATLYAIKDDLTVSNTSPLTQGIFGIYNNNGTLTVNNSTVSATVNAINYEANAVGAGISAGSMGLYNTNGGIATVNNSQINAQANNVIYHADGINQAGDTVGAFGVYNDAGTTTIADTNVQALADGVVDDRTPSAFFAPQISSIIGPIGLYNTKGTMTVIGSSSSIVATATNVDNIGNTPSSQGLLDYVGSFSVYNDGGASGDISTLDIMQAHLLSNASTVTSSIFGTSNPTIIAMGMFNNGNYGAANATLEQGAIIDASATWQVESPVGNPGAVNVLGFYNQGYFGVGNLIADASTIRVTESGGNGAGSVVGGQNGALYYGGSSLATSIVRDGTRINASGTGDGISIYGFYNFQNWDSTDGTSIVGGSIIDSEGGTSGPSIAVFNSTVGQLTIEGDVNQNVILIANGGGISTIGVQSYYLANTAINYVEMQVGSARDGYSFGVLNDSYQDFNMQNTTINVTSSAYNAYGVYNYGTGSVVNIYDSNITVNALNSNTAYGIWDDSASGINIFSINQPTNLYLNYNELAGGTAFAFNSAGTYNGESNVICTYNGVIQTCTTS